ncbi:ABC transporter permease [Streptosporangium sp. DT93]|uniref:ABC transporter permease n=1 Tax=Streptosporangium sp. DT93 TaxID=3393428 RepID=UPI003CEA5E59
MSAVTARRSPRSLVDLVFRARELSIVAALAVLVAVTASTNANFLSGQGLTDIFLNASILVLLAVGQSVVVITRNIDLSAGSVVGLVNGLLVSFGRVPALVVTLGTLYVIQGVGHYIAHGRQINAVDLPPSLLSLGNGSVAGVPYLPVIAVVVMPAVGYHLRSYASGRDLYAIGSSPEAATLAGVPVRRRVMGAYLFSGALAGLAGVLWLSRFGTVVADAAGGWELQVVGAIVVGGAAITGGVGTVYGAALGALLLTTITGALVVLRVNPFWQQAITGALLLLAISVDRLLALRVARVLRRRNARHGS